MQSSIEGFNMIECPRLNRDTQEMDKSGYWFLIRPNFEQGFIECAVCHTRSSKPKSILDIFYGSSAQDIYVKILSRSPQEKYDISMIHAAYLGKELKKAEIALALGIRDYYQE